MAEKPARVPKHLVVLSHLELFLCIW